MKMFESVVCQMVAILYRGRCGIDQFLTTAPPKIKHRKWDYMVCIDWNIWEFLCQKQASRVWLSNDIPEYSGM